MKKKSVSDIEKGEEETGKDTEEEEEETVKKDEHTKTKKATMSTSAGPRRRVVTRSSSSSPPPRHRRNLSSFALNTTMEKGRRGRRKSSESSPFAAVPSHPRLRSSTQKSRSATDADADTVPSLEPRRSSPRKKAKVGSVTSVGGGKGSPQSPLPSPSGASVRRSTQGRERGQGGRRRAPLPASATSQNAVKGGGASTSSRSLLDSRRQSTRKAPVEGASEPSPMMMSRTRKADAKSHRLVRTTKTETKKLVTKVTTETRTMDKMAMSDANCPEPPPEADAKTTKAAAETVTALVKKSPVGSREGKGRMLRSSPSLSSSFAIAAAADPTMKAVKANGMDRKLAPLSSSCEEKKKAEVSAKSGCVKVCTKSKDTAAISSDVAADENDAASADPPPISVGADPVSSSPLSVQPDSSASLGSSRQHNRIDRCVKYNTKAAAAPRAMKVTDGEAMATESDGDAVVAVVVSEDTMLMATADAIIGTYDSTSSSAAVPAVPDNDPSSSLAVLGVGTTRSSGRKRTSTARYGAYEDEWGEVLRVADVTKGTKWRAGKANATKKKRKEAVMGRLKEMTRNAGASIALELMATAEDEEDEEREEDENLRTDTEEESDKNTDTEDNDSSGSGTDNGTDEEVLEADPIFEIPRKKVNIKSKKRLSPSLSPKKDLWERKRRRSSSFLDDGREEKVVGASGVRKSGIDNSDNDGMEERRRGPCGRKKGDRETAAAAPAKKKKKQNNETRFGARWEDHFLSLVTYKSEMGHTLVPKVYPLNQPMATWVSANRLEKRRQDSSSTSNGCAGVKQARNWKRRSHVMEERMRRLEEIGFIWDPKKTEQYRVIEMARKKRASDEDWDVCFKMLVKFKSVNGHCMVPKLYAEDAALARWVSFLFGRSATSVGLSSIKPLVK